MNKNVRTSSSLNGLESAISSGGTVKPVKEKDKPKLALEARLRAAPLLTSSSSNFSWALLDFLMCALLFLLLPLRPGEAPITIRPRLDFRESVPPLSAAPARSFDDGGSGGDLKAAVTFSTSWSDFVLANDVILLLIFLQLKSPL